MKLLIVIVQDQDVAALLEVLVDHDFRATKLASSGGFLRQGNTTLLVGVEDERLKRLLKLIETTCKRRVQGDPTPTVPSAPFGQGDMGARLERISVGGAIVFSVEVERFERI